MKKNLLKNKRNWILLLLLLLFLSASFSINSILQKDETSNQIVKTSSNIAEIPVLVSKIEIANLPYKVDYTNMEPINLTGGSLRVIYSNLKQVIVPMDDTMLNREKLNLVNFGNNTVFLNYLGLETSFTINLIDFRRTITKIELDFDSIKIREAQSFKLNPIVEPYNLYSQSLEFKSSDTSIIQVDNYGVITAIKSGKAAVEITGNGSIKKTITLEVESYDPQLTVTYIRQLGQTIFERLNNLDQSKYTAENYKKAIDYTNQTLKDLFDVDSRLEAEKLIIKLANNINNIPTIPDPVIADNIAPIISNLSVTFTTANTGNISFTTTENGTYFVKIFNSGNYTTNDIITNPTITSSSTTLNITLPLPNLNYSDNYELRIVFKDQANNVSNLLSKSLYNEPSLLLINDWLPIASPTEMQRIRNGATAGTIYGAGSEFQYTLPSNLSSATALTKNYFLVNDIDFTGVSTWTSIGTFSGSFDGQGYKIKNFGANNSLFSSATASLNNPWSIANSEDRNNFIKRFGNFDFVNPSNASPYSIGGLIASGSFTGYLFENINAYSDDNRTLYAVNVYLSIFGYSLVNSYARNITNSIHIYEGPSSSVSSVGGMFGLINNSVAYNFVNKGNFIADKTTNNNTQSSGLFREASNYVKISNSINYGNIKTGGHAGGFIGRTDSAGTLNIIIEDSFNSSDITSGTSNGNNAGGFIGLLNNGGKVTFINSYNAGNIKSNNSAGSGGAGGFVGRFRKDSGYNVDNDNIIVNNSFNYGTTVSTTLNVEGGALIGLITSSSPSQSDTIIDNFILNNFYYLSPGKFIGHISSVVFNRSDIVDKFEAVTDSDMKKQSTFNNFDFTNIWAITENATIPYLKLLPSVNFISYYLIPEANSNNGSLSYLDLIIRIGNSNIQFDPTINLGDLSFGVLPAGLNFTIIYLRFDSLRITFSGTATSNANSDSINMNLVIDKSKIIGSEENITYSNIRIAFID